jgi:hypothetical protein
MLARTVALAVAIAASALAADILDVSGLSYSGG